MVLCLLSSLGMLIRAEIPWECRPSDRRLGPAAFTLLCPISEVPAGGRIGTKVNLSQVPMCVPGVQPVRADSIFHTGPFTSLLTSLCSRSCPTGHLTATGSILKGQPDHASPLLKSLQIGGDLGSLASSTWKCFWLLQLGDCFWNLVGRGQGCC